MIMRFLTVGHACLDIVHMVDRLPTPEIKAASRGTSVKIGGNAANAAKFITRLGAGADLCSVLGNRIDPMTVHLVNELQYAFIGLECAFLESQSCPISSVMVMPDGSRAISSFQPSALTAALHAPEDLSGYVMVLGDTNRLPQVTQVINKARLAGIPTMLDVDKPIDDLQQLPHADITFFSSESWKVFEEQGMQLIDAQKVTGGAVGVTDGANPIRCISKDGKMQMFHPKQVEATDTLGAGDAWRAGLAVSLSSGMPLGRAIERACQTAAEHIQGLPLTRITGE